MIKFREKSYSGLSDTVKGAGIGAGIGVGLNKIGNSILTKVVSKTPRMTDKGKLIFDDKGNQVFNKVIEPASDRIADKLSKVSNKIESGLEYIGLDSLKGANKKFWESLTKLGKWILDNPSKAAFAGALIGASLALGYYLIKRTYNKANQSLATANGSGMLDKVIKELEKSGFKRGVDFTTDPAKADYLKTKVCLVISTSKDEINLMINSISDPKLDKESDRIIKNLPSKTRFYKKESDRNNELTLSTIPSNMDHSYIASVAERFIRRRYPVFLIEVN